MIKVPLLSKLGELMAGKLWAIARLDCFRYPMLREQLLEHLRWFWQHYTMMVVSSWWMAFWYSSQWWLSIQIHQMWKKVSTYMLPWMFWYWDWLEWLSWFLWVMALACWACFNHFPDVFIYSRPIYTLSCMVLELGDSHVFLHVWHVVFSPFLKVGWWELLPLGWVHLLQSWHHGGCGKGIVLWVCPWYPQAILPLLCQQGCAGVGHLGLSSGTPVSSLGWCGHGEWLCQVLPLDQSEVSTLTGHQQLASPFQVSTWWWHHSSAVWAASIEVELGYQQGFFRLICSRGLWSLSMVKARPKTYVWNHVQLWRGKLTSHILCWHIIAL